MKKRAIGLLGGTFDPIHFGHLHLALSLQESHDLQQVLFIPAFTSPYKLHKQITSIEHRLEMVRRAIAPLPSFAIIEYEAARQAPSYTIDTVRYLKQKFQEESLDVDLHLLLGSDILNEFSNWKDAEELAKLAPPLIGSRIDLLDVPTFYSPSLSQPLKRGLTSIPIMDISSTNVRERLKNKMYCGHLAPAKVLEYIYQMKLYHS